jgi:hypothetical protein
MLCVLGSGPYTSHAECFGSIRDSQVVLCTNEKFSPASLGTVILFRDELSYNDRNLRKWIFEKD